MYTVKWTLPIFATLTILVTASVLGMVSRVYAAERSSNSEPQPLFSKQIVLDGTTYTDNDLIFAFKEIALNSFIRTNNFPNNFPLPPSQSPCIAQSMDPTKPCGTPQEYKERYPWLYEYIYREKGEPRYFAINKWTSPIRISIGYPNDLGPMQLAKGEPEGLCPEPGIGRGREPKKGEAVPVCLLDQSDWVGRPPTVPVETAAMVDQAKKIIEEEATKISPIFQELTGLPVSYIPHTKETKDNFANIRILLAPGLSDTITTRIKMSSHAPHHEGLPEGYSATDDHSKGWDSITFSAATESVISTSVRFTPYSVHQVDGFLLPNADNSIGMSFCYIGPANPPRLLRSLVRECLVRSLGLPDATSFNPAMILGLWNERVLSGYVQFPGSIQEPRAKARESLGKQTEPHDQSITEFDQYMIKTLYNPKIKPGMSAIEFYRLVSQYDPNHKLPIRRIDQDGR